MYVIIFYCLQRFSSTHFKYLDSKLHRDMKFITKLFGKKAEPTIFSGDLTLWDLKKGYFLDYFLESWEIKDVYNYSWGNNFFSKEYELDNGKEVMFLHVLKENGFKCSLSKEVSIKSVNSQLKRQIIDYNEPFKDIEYLGKKYYLEEKHEAYVQKEGDSEESFLITWDYVTEDDKETISINKWGETDIESYKGENVKEIEFSNFIPTA